MGVQDYSLVDSFCGPGGMGLGLSQAGFSSVFSFDLNPVAAQTHKANLPGPCIVADAAKLTGGEILERVGLSKGDVSLFAGGPPCQGFSQQNRSAHTGKDDRNRLVLDFARLVSEIEPRAFLFENVATFGKKRGHSYLQIMRDVLGGYNLSPHFYNAAGYGLAQTRKRFIMVGLRKDQDVPFILPSPTVAKWKTVGDVLSGLPEPPEDYTVHPDYPNHQRSRVSVLNVQRFSHVPQGGGWKDIPEPLRLPCHQRVDTSKGGSWPDVYGRLRWDGQCQTITGGFGSFTRGRYGHPHHDRPITAREAARLQGFPDDFEFLGTRQQQRSQIGNVVPPPLAKVVGQEIRRCLQASDKR